MTDDKTRRVVNSDDLAHMAAAQGRRFRSRAEAWADGFREGAQHARLTANPEVGHSPAMAQTPGSDDA